MNIIQPFIDIRVEILNSIEPKGAIEDVIFALTIQDGNVSSSSIHLIPRNQIANLADKEAEVEKIVKSIENRKFFHDNFISEDGIDLVLFFSFDSINLVDSCYTFDFIKSQLSLTLFNIKGNKILSKIISNETESSAVKKINTPPLKTYLFFDTETTGLPKKWKAPVTDLNNWPRLVQLAFILCDSNGNTIVKGDVIIKPSGFVIPAEVSKIHRISHQKAIIEGKHLNEVLLHFDELIHEADYMVAHNMAFDEKVVGAEYLRSSMKNNIANKNKICTMEGATNYCAISSPYGDYKWPKLSELHYKLFNTSFEEAHDAAVDIDVTAKCFWELKNRGLL